MADKKVRFINLNNQILTLGGDGILSFPDIATMASEPIANLQNGAIGWVDSEQKYFQWLDTNEISEMGYWKELIFGSDFQISDPTTSADDERYKNKVVQYIGEDDLTTGFRKGYFYESRIETTLTYVETVCSETTTGIYYILRDGEYLEVTLLGDGTTFDPNETYYKKQDIEVYGWFYINALRVDTELADTDYAIANKTVKAKFDEIIQDYTDKDTALKDYVDGEFQDSIKQYADEKIDDEGEVSEDKTWSNNKINTKFEEVAQSITDSNEAMTEYVDTTLEDYTKSATEILQADYDALEEETKLANNYHCTDTGRMYYKGILYGDKKPIELTYEEYKTLDEAGLVEADVDYVVHSNQSGVLLSDLDTNHGDSEISTYEVIETLKSDVENLIDDTTSSTTNTYSSVKINALNANRQVKTFDNTGASTEKWYKICSALTGGVGCNIKFTASRADSTATVQYFSVLFRDNRYRYTSSYISRERTVYESTLIAQYSAYIIADANNDIWVHVPSYGKAIIEIDTRAVTIDGTAGTPVADYVYSSFEHQYDGKINDSATNTDSTWSSSKIASELKTSSNKEATSITFDETYLKKYATGSINAYIVRNGVCYVSLDVIAVKDTSGDVSVVTSNLPPAAMGVYVSASSLASEGKNGAFFISKYGTVLTVNLTANTRYLFSFSYPIA